MAILLTILSVVLALMLALVTGFYIYCQYNYQYWKKRGIPIAGDPKFPFGHVKGSSTEKNMLELSADLYHRGKDKVVGLYVFAKPILIIRDPQLIKNVLVKDFADFHDRGFPDDLERVDPLAGHLFFLNGQAWRNLRIKLTPTFTSGKMKAMFPIIVDIATTMRQVMDEEVNHEEVDIKEYLTRFTLDVISSTAFGIEANSLKNPDSELLKIGHAISKIDNKQALVLMVLFTCPKLAQYLPIRFIPKEISQFFVDTVKHGKEYRTKNKMIRNDFFNGLLHLMNLGYIPDADNPNKEEDAETAKPFTPEQAAAQAYLFFFAGFETSSATMQFALYELALNPELQEEVQEEIDRVLEKHNGQITYEMQYEMDLLERVISETLRKYPVASLLMRQCNKDYPIEGTEMVIEKGTGIWLPILGYHKDPKHFPDPEKFDPDRFLPNEKDKRHPYAYIPFGEGPRNCIGNRFGLMQTRIGLITTLSNYKLEPSERTPIPMKFHPKTNILAPLDPIYLKLTKRIK